MSGRSDFIERLPKAELHLHIEGTLEPEMMLTLAERNDVRLPWKDLDQVRAAYDFADLQSFLDVYYLGAAALQESEDFFDLMRAYLRRAAADGVRHAEIFFDPQTHTERNIAFPAFMEGFREAMAVAEREDGITSSLIMCFLRHLPPQAALDTLGEAEGHLDGVVAVGLDSSEVGYPPELFVEPYRRAKAMGLRAVAHAGEEGPPAYIRGSLDLLGVERIDHGVRCLEDPVLVERLRVERVPLTVCPLSNVRLKVVDRIEQHPLRELLDEGLVVSINSDDPAYFGGYVAENYRAVMDGLGLGLPELALVARNSIESSFLDFSRKRALLDEIDEALAREEGPASAGPS